MQLKLVYLLFAAAALAVVIYEIYAGDHAVCFLAAWAATGFLDAYSAERLQAFKYGWLFAVAVFAMFLLGACAADYFTAQPLFSQIEDFAMLLAVVFFAFGFSREKKRLDRWAPLLHDE